MESFGDIKEFFDGEFKLTSDSERLFDKFWRWEFFLMKKVFSVIFLDSEMESEFERLFS